MALPDNIHFSLEKPTQYTWRLRIRGVQVTDNGNYTCFVQLTQITQATDFRIVEVVGELREGAVLCYLNNLTFFYLASFHHALSYVICIALPSFTLLHFTIAYPVLPVYLYSLTFLPCFILPNLILQYLTDPTFFHLNIFHALSCVTFILYSHTFLTLPSFTFHSEIVSANLYRTSRGTFFCSVLNFSRHFA